MHATATGLTGDTGNPKEWCFWIAKNAGLDPEDKNSDDEVCRTTLLSFLNLGAGQSPFDRDVGPENEGWVFVRSFWKERIQHCVDNVETVLSELKLLDWEDETNRSMIEAEAKALGRDIIAARKETLSGGGHDPHPVRLSFAMLDCCFIFRSNRAVPLGELPKALKKFINSIEMLGMVRIIWNSLSGLRGLIVKEGLVVNIQFRRSPRSGVLYNEDLWYTVDRWNGMNNFKFQRQLMLEELLSYDNDTFNTFFHSEL